MAHSMNPQELLIHYERTLSLKEQAALKFNLLADLNNGQYYDNGEWLYYSERDRKYFFAYCNNEISFHELRNNQHMDWLYNTLAAYSGGRLGWCLVQKQIHELRNTNVDTEFIEQKVCDRIRYYAE